MSNECKHKGHMRQLEMINGKIKVWLTVAIVIIHQLRSRKTKHKGHMRQFQVRNGKNKIENEYLLDLNHM